MAADGTGTVTALIKGAPFVDPSGLAIDGDKNIYVCDTVQEDGQGSLIAVTPAGVASTIATNVRAGYPCGVSISPDESKVLVSSHDPMTGKSAVSLVDIATKTTTFFSMGIDQDIESGGLHGAKTAKNVYAWCGVTAGQTGTVYKVTLF
jgi:DNA-binding beta-propeller fold protein YncE